MHLLIAHIPEFLKLYGSLAPYSQQGLEKLDDVTKMYYGGTNHRIKENFTEAQQNRRTCSPKLESYKTITQV